MASKEMAIHALLAGAGGALAGYADQKYAKRPGGFTVGLIGGAALVALAVSGKAGKFADKALFLGMGAMGGELYRVGANRQTPGAVTLPPVATAATQGIFGVRGVGALPPAQRIATDDDLLRSISELQATA